MKKIKSLVSKILPTDLKHYILRKYNAMRSKKQIEQIYDHYRDVEDIIRHRKMDAPLRVASYVVFDSCFGAYSLYQLMFEDLEHYDPKVVIIPDVSRGEQHLRDQYNATKKFFIKKYGSQFVIDGWNESTGEFIDVSDMFDIIYLSNPYDPMVNRIHGVGYLSTKNCLPMYISYGCLPDNYSCKVIMTQKEISLFWKVFADNEMSFKDYKKYELAKGQNVVLSGYAKMDSLANFSEKPKNRKRIIIAPHHTIANPEFPLSNFLKYHDYILELPKLYPSVDFIFRPHPLLFVNLVNARLWTQTQVDDYIRKVEETGMVYSSGGDYLDVFVNSDAMIHDCSSFVVEYLYTGKPCCFAAKKNYKSIFANLGKKCLDNYYLAFDRNQIDQFIQQVVIEGNDTKKDKRESFAKDNLAINYPNAGKKILEEITL